MLKVGITGGIGAGKSVVCKIFETLGIPVLYADSIARWLMENDIALKNQVLNLFGENAYVSNQLNRSYISSVAFTTPEKLEQLNEIVHPATIHYVNEWMQKQTSAYIIKEAAIFFETGSDKDIDVMIGVFAPLETRISRAMQRNNFTREDVLQRIAKQMDEDEKMKRCDYVILNDDATAVLRQVLALHDMLLKG